MGLSCVLILDNALVSMGLGANRLGLTMVGGSLRSDIRPRWVLIGWSGWDGDLYLACAELFSFL
jgi:hypothetical protein